MQLFEPTLGKETSDVEDLGLSSPDGKPETSFDGRSTRQRPLHGLHGNALRGRREHEIRVQLLYSIFEEVLCEETGANRNGKEQTIYWGKCVGNRRAISS